MSSSISVLLLSIHFKFVQKQGENMLIFTMLHM